jgi:hypothetical protein
VSAYDDVVLVIGPDAAKALVARFGGVGYYINARCDGPTFAAFAGVIGEAAACALFRYFAGEDIALPSPRTVLRDELRQAAREMQVQGLTYAQIADALVVPVRYTERQIRALLAEPSPDVCQVDPADGPPEDRAP